MWEQVLSWDSSALLALQGMHNPVLDFLMPIITTLGNGGMLWIALTAVLLIFRKTRRIAIVMGAALLLTAVVTSLILKPWIARPRPFATFPWISMIIPEPSGFSFPSGHTSSSFAAATVLWFRSWKLALPATVLASAIGFSRLYLFCHYPTDGPNDPVTVTDRDIPLMLLGWGCNVFRPPHPLFPPLTDMQIGRASCRERVCKQV